MLNIVLFSHLVIALLSFAVFGMLLKRFLSSTDKGYKIKSLTQILALIAFFIFLDRFFSFMAYIASSGLVKLNPFILVNPTLPLLSSAGIFVSLVLMAHLLFAQKIDQIKNDELSLKQLQAKKHRG